MDKITVIVSIISALLSGGIVFFAQLHINKKNRIREDKLKIFKTLMETRYILISHEKTRALNSIEIIFNDSTIVKTAWSELYKTYDDLSIEKDSDKIKKLKDESNEKLTVLLEKMAKNLDYKDINWEVIKKPYCPIGLYNDMINEESFKYYQKELIQGLVEQQKNRDIKTNDSLENVGEI